MNQTIKQITAAAGLALGIAAAVQAASPSVWDGGHGSSANWNQKQNWNNNIPVPGITYDLQFAGVTRLTNNNDFAVNSNFRNITFNSGAGAFVLGGNAITLNGGITNNSANTETINLGMALTAGNHSVNAASGNLVLGGALSGTGSLTKSGANTLTMTAVNSYNGATTVSMGGLIVNGSLTASDITVSSGAFLGGTGTVQAVTMDAGSILSAGNSPGTMTFNAALLLSAGSTNMMEILSDSLYDILKNDGGNTLTMNGETIFDFTGNTTVTNGSTFAVFQNWGAIAASGAIFSTVGLDAALSLDTSQLATTGYVTVIPEPAAIGLLAFGAVISIFISHLRRWLKHS